MSYDSAARAHQYAPQTSAFSDSPVTAQETIDLGRQVIAAEARTLVEMLPGLDEAFATAVEKLRTLEGNLIVTGMGKAGLIGRKLTATFASTGTTAHYLHPAEAFHGDLGRVTSGDVVLVLSQSGETGEVSQLLAPLQTMGVYLIAMTASSTSTLGRAADLVLPLGRIDEACPLGLAPSASTTAMLALGDALALVTSRLRGFEPEDFARYHPGGALGFKLSRVEDHMRTLEECRVADDVRSIREVLVTATRPGRRSGAIMLTDSTGTLTGLFTDSDLARLIEKRDEAALDEPISTRMIGSPTTIQVGEPMSAAVNLLADRKISELPVVDEEGCPVGMIDVTDIVGQLPKTSKDKPEVTGPPTVKIFPDGDHIF
ncbi:MAG: KpsF/GutQ family sugar-phosphate isomerase [Lacipirellulaceae bacterium]